MKPLEAVVVTRGWNWGGVFLGDPGGSWDVPDLDGYARVSANASVVVIQVRHAQDLEHWEGEVDWAEATAAVRHWEHEPAPHDGTSIAYEGLVTTPTSRLSIGDGESSVEMQVTTTSTRLRVSSADTSSPDFVFVDVRADLETDDPSPPQHGMDSLEDCYQTRGTNV